MADKYPTVDVAVIGLGLIGSAALRHLALTGCSALGIGPAEPEISAESQMPFSSHYDSGRITRRLDARWEWSLLASRSIANYPVIEAGSGVSFHRPSGMAFVRSDEAGVAAQVAVAERFSIPVAVELTGSGASGLPHLNLPAGFTSIYEDAPAGHIDPRLLVSAQLRSAESSGAYILRDAAQSAAFEHGLWTVATAGGSTVRAANLLVATGPYPNDLLGANLAVTVRPEAVVMAQVTAQESERLTDLPALIYLLDHPELDDVYLVPPVQYPDGNFYVKMGGSHVDATSLDSTEAKRSWMSGRQADRQLGAMRPVLESILPTVGFESWVMKPCMIADTVSGLPMIDEVEKGLFVALGGNGHAAKSSDAIGALAAGLVVNEGAWSDVEFSPSTFEATHGSHAPITGSRHGRPPHD